MLKLCGLACHYRTIIHYYVHRYGHTELAANIHRPGYWDDLDDSPDHMDILS